MGFRVWGLRLRDLGFRLRVQGLFMAYDLGYRGFRAWDLKLGFRA